MTAQLDPGKLCSWCGERIPATARLDAETCSKKCRQARHRFRIAPATGVAEVPLRFGYFDPPYPGKAYYYKDQPTFAGEVDHAELLARACEQFPDGWALSTSASAVQMIMKLAPDGVRQAIWVKGSRAGVSYRARNAYEPVILWGGRPRRMEPSEVLDDVLIWGGRQHSHPGALIGMKSAPFCEWLFRQLGALAGDYLTDVFPGSGAIMRAWESFGGRNGTPTEEAELRLPFADIISAPPVPRRRTTDSRLEEATRRAGEMMDPKPEAESQPEKTIEHRPAAAPQLGLFGAER